MGKIGSLSNFLDDLPPLFSSKDALALNKQRQSFRQSLINRGDSFEAFPSKFSNLSLISYTDT